MNKKFTIIFVIIMVLLVAGSFIFRKTLSVQGKLAGTPTSLTKPTITSNPTQTIDAIVGSTTTINDINISNWNTFVSSNNSFSYKYPSVDIKLDRNALSPSYLQFSDIALSEDEKKNAVFNNPEIVIAFAHDSAEYKAHMPTFDYVDKKNITVDAKAAHEDIFFHNGKISGIIIYFDEFAEKLNEDPISNTYSSNKYGFGLISIDIYPPKNQKADKYLLLAEKIISTLKFLK